MTVTPLRIPAQSPPCLPDTAPSPLMGRCDACEELFPEVVLDVTGCRDWLCPECLDTHYSDFRTGCAAPECND
jgi:hypothetical protein